MYVHTDTHDVSTRHFEFLIRRHTDPIDYCGYFRNKVFSTPSQDIDVLHQRITDTFDELR